MLTPIVVLSIVSILSFFLPLVIFTPKEMRDHPVLITIWAIVDIVVCTFYVYAFLPAMVGPAGGCQNIWLPLLVNVIIALTVILGFEEAKMGTVGGIPSVAIIVLLIVHVLIVNIFTTWGDGNTKALSGYANVTISSQDYPDTDVTHMAIVSLGVAEYKGGQALGQSGQNLGSLYHATSYTLQSVKGHLYWVAPLVYNNIFANISNFESPGIVIVDAEDPNATARLNLENKLHYLPDALFNQDLTRHVYQNGYSNYRLIEPTLEVDDDWNPYFTIDISTYVRGYTGISVVGLLVVDSKTGNIELYSMDKVPDWVDRAIPGVAAQEYIDWWGKWNAAPWINFSGAGAQMSADDIPDIAYSRADKSPVWQFVMTSTSSEDHSSTGIILYDTRTRKGTFYQIPGIAVGSDVTLAFSSNPKNLKDYDVSQLILHKIYGQLTWVGSFISIKDKEAGGTSATFQGIGLLNATTTQGSNVIMQPSKEEALREYERWLANRGSNTTNPTEPSVVTEIEGYVTRIAEDVQNGNTIYYLMINNGEGDLTDHIFYGTSTVSEKLPLTENGDHVAIRFTDTNERVAGMIAFNNLDIHISLVDPTTGAPLPTPTEIPTSTPTITPTLAPTPIAPSLFENNS